MTVPTHVKSTYLTMTTTPGLSYPNDKNYLTTVKDRGYFIHVDHASDNISLLAGGDINRLITENKELFFIFGMKGNVSDVNIAGSRQDIIDALYLSGYSVERITELVSAGISADNIESSASQQWITIFKDRNNGKITNTQQRETTNIANTQQTKMMKPVAQTPTQGEHPPNITYPVTSNYTSAYIMYLRQIIHTAMTETYLGKNANFEAPPNILQELFRMYDEVFFGKGLSAQTQSNNIRLTLTYSDRMTKTGGCCSVTGCSYEIRLSQHVILNTFRKGENFHISNGLQCYDRLDCLMNVFEHELIHFIIGINGKSGKPGHIKGDPIYKSHGIYFRQLMKAYFGHTECVHNLTEDGEANTGKIEHFHIGQYVTYTSKKDEPIVAKIDKLNPKRAVIGNMTVPYEMLRVATEEEVRLHYDPAVIKLKGKYKDEIDAFATKKNFMVGDIVSYPSKERGIVTDRISRINPKTYLIGKYKVSHAVVRIPTAEEKALFLKSPAANVVLKTRDDFYMGQNVKFTCSKTRELITGQVVKLNPTRAIIAGYSVPYHMLFPV